MPKLTKRLIDSIPCPATGQIFVRDEELPGLALRVTSAGSKAFVFEWFKKGRSRRLTIGSFGPWTVDQAREEARKYRVDIDKGKDPAQERADKNREVMFKELADIYLERHAKIHKKSWKKDDQMLKNHLHVFNGRKISAITRQDIAKLHQEVGEKNGKYIANRMIELLRKMLNLAVDWGLTPEGMINPATRIKRFAEEKRDRFLSPDEFKKVFQALQNEPNSSWRGFFLLSLFLGTRRNELLSARWQDFDLNSGLWRIPETKSGRPHVLPIPQAAMKLLERLGSKASSPWLFPGPGKSGHLTSPFKAWERVCKRAKVEGVRIHDCRRTVGSWLAMAGHSLGLIGKVLNHQNVQTTQVYSRFAQDTVREALEDHTKKILEVVQVSLL